MFIPVTEFWLGCLLTIQDNVNQENYSRWACFSNKICFLHMTGHILEQIFLVKYITLKSSRQINLKLAQRSYRKSQIKRWGLHLNDTRTPICSFYCTRQIDGIQCFYSPYILKSPLLAGAKIRQITLSYFKTTIYLISGYN